MADVVDLAVVLGASLWRLALASGVSSSSVSFLLRIAQWEEIEKTSVSTELSAFKTLS